jgi:hypothetical protein
VLQNPDFAGYASISQTQLTFTIGDNETDFVHAEVTNGRSLSFSCTWHYVMSCPDCAYENQLFLKVDSSMSTMATAYPYTTPLRILQGKDNLAMEENGKSFQVIATVYSTDSGATQSVSTLNCTFSINITKNCNPNFIQITEMANDRLAEAGNSIKASTTVQASLKSRTKIINRMDIQNIWDNKWCLNDFNQFSLRSAQLSDVYSSMFDFTDPHTASLNPNISFVAIANSDVMSPDCNLSTSSQISSQISPITYTQSCTFTFEVEAFIGMVSHGYYTSFNFTIYNECIGLNLNEQVPYMLWHYKSTN